jgi:hypothetical protein
MGYTCFRFRKGTVVFLGDRNRDPPPMATRLAMEAPSGFPDAILDLHVVASDSMIPGPQSPGIDPASRKHG